MRHIRLPLFTLLCSAAPLALWADTIEAPSKVSSVVLYPWGASVTRQVELSAPAGVHELIVPDLPQGTDASQLRVSGEGVRIGSVTLVDGRKPVTGDMTPPEVQAARDTVERLEIALEGREVEVEAIRLKAAAAREQIAFLRAMKPEATGAEDLRALSQMVGAEVLAASQAALAADQEALAAERDLKSDREALEKARQALAALIDEGAGKMTLAASVEGNGVLEITTFTPNASWQPVYDLRLERKADRLTLERGVVVSQYSGEDWSGVELILSTARPADQSAPTQLWPWLRRVGPPDAPQPLGSAAPRSKLEAEFSADAAMAAAPEPVMVERAATEMMGATVTYRYGAAVEIRDGVEALRLKLDDIALSPEVVAEAVPARDATAFLVATAQNDSDQVLLPGPATLFADGAMVGQAHLPLTAAGDELRLGFGPIDGIRLERLVPEKTEGDRGVISKSNEMREVAILKIENLTGEAWPLRVIDQVPYSEQEDLVIRHTATPPASETDLDGQRGILAWDFELGAAETREIRLETTLSWPSGQILH